MRVTFKLEGRVIDTWLCEDGIPAVGSKMQLDDKGWYTVIDIYWTAPRDIIAVVEFGTGVQL